MAEAPEKPFRIFYSWQSDLPVEGNAKLIRAALDAVAAELNGDHELHLHVTRDEATSNLPGSPNIAAAILAKIQEVDVFVCDLSKVAEVINEAGETRRYCNPNVAIELGYAIRVLGWDRIVLVFNTAYGRLPDDLPFDARGHRTLPYTCKIEFDAQGKPTAAAKTQMSNAKGQLKATLLAAMREVIQSDPRRPEELKKKTPAEIKREKDLQQLQRVFHWIHLGVMDSYIERLQSARTLNAGTFMFDGLCALVSSSSFHLYDTELKTRLTAMMEVWGKSQQHQFDMEQSRNGMECYFHMPGDIFQSKKQEEQVKFVMAQAGPLKKAFAHFLAGVAEHYFEIDPQATGMEAYAQYLKDEKELKKLIKLNEQNERHY